MTTSYQRAATPDQVWACLMLLQARTLVFDVEPLVAFWRTDQGVLAEGITAVLAATAGAAPDSVVFATNSVRRPPATPAVDWTTVGYLASARKPVRVSAYHDLSRPGVVIGDQVATDGVLAWRLGYAFVHYTPRLSGVPLGPRLMRRAGRPLRPLLFRHAGKVRRGLDRVDRRWWPSVIWSAARSPPATGGGRLRSPFWTPRSGIDTTTATW